jgi:DNA mismatch endonuclease (patch repair protein)
MSRVRSKDTKPELAVRRLVFGMGCRYRLHDKRLPGRPDLVFRGRRKIVFVNGCFWHGHEGCRYARTPKSREDFWRAKVERNRERDGQNIASLEADGWKVLTVWQCELKDLHVLEGKLHEFLLERA